MLRAAFAWRDATDDVGAVLDHLLRVESAFAAGEALDEQASFFVDQYAQRAPPARATTFWAPSFMPSAMVKFKPLSRRICWPTSTLVPSMRMTTGTFSFRSLAAATTPVARTSHRKMPPKILMKTALTSGSLMRMRKAFLTCSEEAPPPTSRKFAGEPPAYLMMSMDVGGGASSEQVKNAFRILMSDPEVKAVFINIFGGILRCDVLATGVVAAAKDLKLNVPVVIRMEGTNVEVAQQILRESGLNFTIAVGLQDGAQKVVALAGGVR